MVKRKEPFELIECIGTGGFAQTWYARVIDPDLIEDWGSEYAAIKIPLSKEKEKALKKEFHIYIALQSQLTRKESINIAKYLGVEVFQDKFVMAMEYIPDGSLRNLIGKIGAWKRLDIPDAVDIAIGVLKGISVIHKKHVVHRDIKPDNILMVGKLPKIADFGIGRILRSNELASTTTGTLYYMSPEILYEDKGALANTDLWSFGIMLYEMLCEDFPFGINKDMPPGKVMDLIRDEKAQLVFSNTLNIPQEFKNVISKMLRRNPNERYKTADEALEDLFNMKRGDDDCKKELLALQGLLHDPVQVPAAEKQLNKLLKKFPNSHDIYLQFGEFYNRCGDFDRALEIFKKGIKSDSGYALFHWGMSIAYQQKRDYRSALSALETALLKGLEPRVERQAKAMLRMLQQKI